MESKSENKPSRIALLVLHYRRDIWGILFLVSALLVLFGFLGLAEGTVLSSWVAIIQKVLGWGSYIIPLLFLFFSFISFRKKTALFRRVSLERVLFLELLFFTLLAIIAIVNGRSLTHAEQGVDGGIVGWSIVTYLDLFFPEMITNGVLVCIGILFLGMALDLHPKKEDPAPSFQNEGENSSYYEPEPARNENARYVPPVEVRESGALIRDDSIIGASPSSEVTPHPEFPQVESEGKDSSDFRGGQADVSEVNNDIQNGLSLPLLEASKNSRKSPSREREKIESMIGTSDLISTPVVQNDNNSIAKDGILPSLGVLLPGVILLPDERQIHEMAALLRKTLEEFGIPAKVTGYRVGPTIIQFAVEPGMIEKVTQDGTIARQKIRVAQIAKLSKDLALALSAERLRIEAPVPGQPFVGIEVPNPSSALVRLRPLLESEAFQKTNSPLAIALGRDVSGEPLIADLARMPHLLIAGSTGSGKSVCISTIITCLVMNNTPADLRLAMLDPKMVELIRFNGLPHLLGKVEVEINRMIAVLQWALVEMDNRYALLEKAHAKDIESYNRMMQTRSQKTLPRIVILIDELADLMQSASDVTEYCLMRLAQMARATGIHLVVATQRPSTEVITGVIKTNFPARIAFTTATSVDSRVILDEGGAETLLGKGDMLFLNPEVGVPFRAQGALISNEEMEQVVRFWKGNTEKRIGEVPWDSLVDNRKKDDSSDKLLDKAIEIARSERKISASLLQRRLRIGFSRATRLLDEIEDLGILDENSAENKIPNPQYGEDEEEG